MCVYTRGCVCARARAMQGILKIFAGGLCRARLLTRRLFTDETLALRLRRRSARNDKSERGLRDVTRLERVFLVLFLQRASVLTGSSRVKIGVSRNSSGETFFWTRQMDCYRMTNSRYSVRYIPLYVDCHTYSILLFAHISPAERAPLSSVISTGQRSGGQCKHLRAE